MPAVYSNAMKVARQQVIITALGAAGELVIGTAAMAGGAGGVLARVPLANPPFSVAGAGVMTLLGTPRTVNAVATGVAAKAELRHADGTVIMSGLIVGVAGTANLDVLINATEISTGQTVQATLGTITHG